MHQPELKHVSAGQRALIFGCTAAEAADRAAVLGGLGFVQVFRPSSLVELATVLRREVIDLMLISERGGNQVDPFVNGVRRQAGLASRRAHIIVTLTQISPPDAERLRDCGVSQLVQEPLQADELGRRVERMRTDRRKFIESPGYCGPDRRVRNLKQYGMPTRRVSDYAVVRGR